MSSTRIRFVFRVFGVFLLILMLTSLLYFRVPQFQSFVLVKLLEIQAANGSSEAAFDLGHIYLEGDEVKRDVPRSIVWLQKAISLGNTDAINDLGTIYDGDYPEVGQDSAKALALYQLGASKGDNFAMYNIALKYSHFDKHHDANSPPNYALAKEWYEKSLSAGPQTCAANDLGVMYALGLGVKKNKDKAIAYFNTSVSAYSQEQKMDSWELPAEIYAYDKYSSVTKTPQSDFFNYFKPHQLDAIKEMEKLINKQCWG